MTDKRYLIQQKNEDGTMSDLKLDPTILATTSSDINLTTTSDSDEALSLNATGAISLTTAKALTVNGCTVKSVITNWVVDESAGTISITVEDLF